jgi:hypothetical protein
MRIACTLLLISFSAFLHSQSNDFRYYPQPPLAQGYYYGSPEMRHPVKTADNGYVLSFFPWSPNLHTIYPFDTYTIKTDSNFVPQWKKPYYARAISLPTGGIVLLYNTMLTNGLYSGMHIEKVTAAGVQVWNKNISGENIVLNDGVLYGNTIRFVGRKRGNTGWPSYAETSQAFTLEMDTSGVLLSQSYFSSSTGGNVDFSSIKRDGAGNFYVYSEFDPTTSSTMMLAKFSPSFTPVWANRYSAASNPVYIEDIDILSNGMVIATGMVQGNNALSWYKPAILKFSSSGSLLQAKFLENTWQASGLCKTNRGTYIISANKGNFFNDSLVSFEADTSLNILWHKFRATGHGSGTSILRNNKLYTPGFDGVSPFIINSDTLGNNCSSVSRSYSALTVTNQVVNFTLTAATSTISITSATLNNVLTQSYSDTCKCVAFIVSNPVSQQVCAGVTATVQVSGTSNISWYATSTGTTFLQPGNFYGYGSLTPTVHTVYAQDSTCASANRTPVTFLVHNTPTLTTTSSPVLICSGGQTVINVSGASSYIWSNSATTPTLNVTASNAVYTVTGYNNAGCYKTATVGIAVVPTPTLSIINGNTIICQTSGYQLLASGATSYTWSTGQTTSSVAVSPTLGVNIYIVTGANGACTSTAQTLLGTIPSPTITASVSPSIICQGKQAVLSAFGANSFTWNGTHAGSNFSVSPYATSIYTVEGTSTSNTCISTKTILVNVAPSPTINVSQSDSAVCAGSQVLLNASGANTFSWSTGTTGSSITVAPQLTTTYTVTGTAANNCSHTGTLMVVVNPAPVISFSMSKNPVCPGETVVLVAGGANSYNWHHVSSGSPSTMVHPTVTTSYSVTAVSIHGCSSSSFATINVYNTTPIVVGSASICAGQLYTINPSGGGSYSVSGGSAVVSPSASTVYTITGTSIHGCTLSAVHSTIAVYPLPTISVNSGTICAGETFTIIPTGAMSYTVSGGSFFVSPPTTSLYSVTGTGPGGCNPASTSTSSVVVKPSPLLQVTSTSPTVCAGETITLTATGATNYAWDNFTTGSSHVTTLYQTTIFAVQGTGVNGCVGTGTITQIVDLCTDIEPVLYGNSFSVYPNPNDGRFQIGSFAGNIIHADVYSITGQLTGHFHGTNGEIKVDISILPAAIYLVRVRSGEHTAMFRVIRN